MTSPLSEGLFDRAISQSGYGSLNPLADAKQDGVDFAESLGIDNPASAEALAELRALPWQDIVANAGRFYRLNPTQDGWSTPNYESYADIFAAAMQHDVPFIIGMTQNDIGPVSRDTVNLVANATPLSSPMWVYEFRYMPTNWQTNPSGEKVEAWHSLENGYVFGNWPFVPLINFRSYGAGAGLDDPDPGFDERDPWMSEWLMQAWIRFAKTGDPNPKSRKKFPNWSKKGPKWCKKDSYKFDGQCVPIWVPHTAEADQYLQIDYPPVLDSGFTDPDRP